MNGDRLPAGSAFDEPHAAEYLRSLVSAVAVRRGLVVTPGTTAVPGILASLGLPALRTSTPEELSRFGPAAKNEKFDLVILDSVTEAGLSAAVLAALGLLARKGHLVIGPVLEANRPVVRSGIEKTVKDLRLDPSFETRLINLGAGILTVKKK